eukprot:226690-Lingulodinium_polyedra.AAC.1
MESMRRDRAAAHENYARDRMELIKRVEWAEERLTIATDMLVGYQEEEEREWYTNEAVAQAETIPNTAQTYRVYSDGEE